MLLNDQQITDAIRYNQGQIEQGNLSDQDIEYLLALGAAYFQSEKDLVIDGKVGPNTQKALEEERENDPQEVPKGLPSGKGMFIRSLSHTGRSAQEAVGWALDHGLDWVVIQRITQFEDKDSTFLNGTKLESYSKAFREAGIQVWVWGWPTPSKIDEFVRVMYEAVDTAQATGMVLDPEAPWIGTKGPALDLMSLLLEEAGKRGTLVGMTSYGAPWSFETFPWEEFRSAHFGMPQVYDSKNNLPEDYPEQSLQAWKDLGYSILLPISAAYNKTPEQMEDLLERTPTPVGALSWWDWFNANQAPERWDVISAFEIPQGWFHNT